MSRAASIVISMALMALAPTMVLLGRLERGEWAIGGEWLLAGLLMTTAICLLLEGRK